MKKIDLNVDLGEGFENDQSLLKFATSANVCCGVHAGSAELTKRTVEMCLESGVRVGIHPGYPDRNSMGRLSMEVDQQLAYLNSLREQILSFPAEYQAAYIKPHGGFYNDTAKPISQGWDSMSAHPSATTPYEAGGHALSLVPGTGLLTMALRVRNLPLMGLPGTYQEQIALRAKVEFYREGFADRQYLPDGTLLPRSEPGAVLRDPAEIRSQVLRLAPLVDSICLHGDTPEAVFIASIVVKALEEGGYEVGI